MAGIVREGEQTMGSQSELGMASADQRILTKAEFTARNLRRLIVTGEVQPGERVVIGHVARELGVSDTPVREAVKQLVAEGLLVEIPHVGPMVPEFTVEEVCEAFEMRAVLSALVIKLNAPYYSADTLGELDAILAESKEAIDHGDPAAYGETNVAFHVALMDTGHFERLKRVYLRLMTQTKRLRAGFGLFPSRMAPSYQEHCAIRNALANGEYIKAGELADAHERTAMRALLDYIEDGSSEEQPGQHGGEV